MKAFALGLAAAGLLAASASGQTTGTRAATNPATAPGSTSSSPNGGTTATVPVTGAPPSGGVANSRGAAAPMTSAPVVGAAPGAAGAGHATASGDANPAIATASDNAATPARGANSFTRGQAASRIAAHGFTNVGGLKKDRDGVWRGSAERNGQQVSVWLDYKGNVGAR
jgi:hypothetical protein